MSPEHSRRTLKFDLDEFPLPGTEPLPVGARHCEDSLPSTLATWAWHLTEFLQR